MPAVHETYDCPACKRRHVLYFAAGDSPDSETSYKFVCPQTGFIMRDIGSAAAWKPVNVMPQGAVEVQKLD